MFPGKVLTSSHRASVPEERERVLARGGEIPECSKGECARVNGLIEVTRSLGDRWLKPVLDCTPEIVVYRLTAEDAFLVIGSDGLFDCIVDDVLVWFLDVHSRSYMAIDEQH
jgi:protein phosphatase 2C